MHTAWIGKHQEALKLINSKIISGAAKTAKVDGSSIPRKILLGNGTRLPNSTGLMQATPGRKYKSQISPKLSHTHTKIVQQNLYKSYLTSLYILQVNI